MAWYDDILQQQRALLRHELQKDFLWVIRSSLAGATEPQSGIEPKPDADSERRTQVVAPKATTKPHRGRRPKYKWTHIQTGLGAKLAADGLPASGDGGQTRLEAWVAQQFPEGNRPSESVIRAQVVRAIAAHRAALNEQAGK